MNTDTTTSPALAGSIVVIGALAVGLALLFYAAYDGVLDAFDKWSLDEYSYGYFIPFLIAFFIWQRKNELATEPFTGSWLGVSVVLFGVICLIFGELATLHSIIQYGFAISVMGIALSMLGWKAFKWISIPLTMLFFTVPLPNFLYNNLSQSLQLISSEIGVWVVMQFGISVFLEGNVIELESMKLQVAEACSGLRYLFPLMAVGFIVAYIYRAPVWKRVTIFLSTIPITVLMNSFRIGMIGVTVDHWGKGAAEGFLHDFEGWVVFMASLGVLLVEMWLLSFIGGKRKPVLANLYIELPGALPVDARLPRRYIPNPFYATMGILLVTASISFVLPNRAEIVPEREPFADFPLQIDEWRGTSERLESIYLDELKLDDYLIGQFANPQGDTLQVYMAYYGSQRKGASVHSPRSCIPGGGWEIQSLDLRSLENVQVNGQPLTVNRVRIQLGQRSQLVYYWFQQRGRVLTNEYAVKWYIFWDALTRKRTDGSLVRLVTYVPPGGDIAAADARLAAFARKLNPLLTRYIPD